MIDHQPMRRVAILWEHLTDYLHAALAAVRQADPGIEILAVQRIRGANVPQNQAAPFAYPILDLTTRPAQDTGWINELIEFDPDIAVITGTSFRPYREAAKRLRQRQTITVWASDRIRRNPGRDVYQAIWGRYGRIWQHYDAALVPGIAATRYAQFIGFPAERIFQGLYSGDTAVYRPIGWQRHQNPNAPWPAAFLFVGQLIERKGIDTLLDAYRLYRQQTATPWPLWLAGTGPLQADWMTEPGVTVLGYRPKVETAVLMSQAGCLVLPSRWDHWGVVVHEAACAGLPIIASTTCGAATDLIQPHVNGFVFPPTDAAALAHLLLKVDHEGNGRQLGQNSLYLSHRFDPQLFAQTVLHAIPEQIKRAR